MSETVPPSPDNPAERRGRQGLNKPTGPTSQGWSRADRAPRLRRYADRLEAEAERARGERRVKLLELAREMRGRATEIELDGQPADELESTVRMMQAASLIELT